MKKRKGNSLFVIISSVLAVGTVVPFLMSKLFKQYDIVGNRDESIYLIAVLIGFCIAAILGMLLIFIYDKFIKKDVSKTDVEKSSDASRKGTTIKPYAFQLFVLLAIEIISWAVAKLCVVLFMQGYTVDLRLIGFFVVYLPLFFVLLFIYDKFNKKRLVN